MHALFFSFLWGCALTLGPSSTENSAIEEEMGDVGFDFENVDLGVQANNDCVQYLGYQSCDIILKDQNDEYFRLYDHKGKVILLDFSTGWCGPCKQAAATVEETQVLYEEDDFLYITVLIEDDEGQATTLGYAQEWANSYRIETAPVLQGSRDLIDYNGVEGYNLTGWPTFYVIDRDMKLDSGIRGYDEEWIHQHIQDVL